MTITANEFERLGSVSGFNNAVLHCKSLIGMLGGIGGFDNLADILNKEVSLGNITLNQVNPIIAALLKDKFNYFFLSHNLLQNFSDFSSLQETVVKWKALDMVIVYHHPELGINAINPKNPKSFEGVNLLKSNEILVLYAGAFGNTFDAKLASDAIQNIIAILNGKKAKQIAALEKGKFGFTSPKEPKVATIPAGKPAAVKSEPAKRGRKTTSVVIEDVKQEKAKPVAQQAEAPRPAPAAPPIPVASTGRKTMTPMYAVPVTNELFHNGNVEAWKKIIASYTAKYPGSEVYIFYEGERIHDINTLFKWGKVKHGSSIMFAVSGDVIKDVAKLQRYFRQGASHRFEDFLRFPVNSVLNLF